MLNLSDKELDRLSREAADEHDPGDLMGPHSWERLVPRLDKELGRVGSGPMQGIRGIRRMFYYYTPVIILLVVAGITYLVRQGKSSNARTEPSGSPPTAVIKSMTPNQNNSNDNTDPSTKTSENSNNSTSNPADSLRSESTISPGSATPGLSSATADKPTLAPNTTATNRFNTRPANATAADHSASPGQSSTTSGRSVTDAGPTVSGKSTIAPNSTASGRSTTKPSTELSGSTGPNGTSSGTPNSSATGSSTRPSVTTHNSAPGKSSATTGRSIVAPGATASERSTSTPNSILSNKPVTAANATSSGRSANSRRSTTPNEGPAAAGTPAGTKEERSALNSPRRNRGRNNRPATKNNDNDLLTGSPSTGNSNTSTGNGSTSTRNGNPDSHNAGPIGNAHNDNTTSEQKATREPRLALIQAPHLLARSRGIDDSALRAFTLKGASASTPIRLDKKKNASLFINRPLQIGFSFSPDFASVSALAGDRPGSSVGVTLDYQFLDRLYLSTGILLTRKNYASSPRNYHVPANYYQMNNAHDVNLIKGAFYMMEIPLNLRYDFHLSDNTSFFLSGGSSSYLMTSEHSQYYYNYFGMQACRDFSKDQESKRRNYLFSTVNLSMGVETGLSNSLSMLIAPYVKVPTGGIGFGQVQITSVGINFALKFAPVVSRKRQH